MLLKRRRVSVVTPLLLKPTYRLQTYYPHTDPGRDRPKIHNFRRTNWTRPQQATGGGGTRTNSKQALHTARATVSGPPVTMYALRELHMTSLRWQQFGGLDLEIRPTSSICRNSRCSRGFRQTRDIGRTSKSKRPYAYQRRLVI